MVQAPGVSVPAREAEATRRRLQADGTLRLDLHPLKDGEKIVFAVDEAPETFDFREREVRPDGYQDLLPEHLREIAPRAFEAMGDIAIVKVPQDLWGERETLGAALLEFVGARAVFHDGGVQGTFRVRDLTRIGGTGDSATVVQENGFRLHVDVGQAYFSPRLASERARVADLVQPGESVVDLFGGVAPFAVQAARAGGNVVSIDLNPAAEPLAQQNAESNGVNVDVRCGDAREVAAALPPADRIVMNLPHGAKHFLDVAVGLSTSGTVVHYHEIMPDADKSARCKELETALSGAVASTRHVRNYAKGESHWVFDVVVA